MIDTNKRKKLLILTAGNIDHSSSRIRALQFIPFFEKENYKVTWIPRIGIESEKKINRLLFPFLKRYFYLKMRLFLIFGDWDVVFIQRLFIEEFFLKQIKKRKRRLIYDFDDAIYLDENKQSINSISTSLMIGYSNAVIVSTFFLEPFCVTNGKTPFIIPTSVNGEVIKPLQNKSSKECVTIGWIGSKWTTPFLKEVEESLRLLSKNINYKLLVVGADQNYKPTGINIEHLTWNIEKEIEYLKLMDIGIMPLPNTEFAKGKGGFKLYLYMASGIPVVASPVGINTDIVKHGVNGFLASDNFEWEKALGELIKNPKLREKMGHEGRVEFEKKYSTNIAFENLNRILSNF